MMSRREALKASLLALGVDGSFTAGYYYGAHDTHPENALALFGIAAIPAALWFAINLCWPAKHPDDKRDANNETRSATDPSSPHA